MSFLRNWLVKNFPEKPQQNRPERREVPGLEAVHWTGSSPGLDIVRNISATGMYLVTRERWPEGETHPIRLVYPELADDSPENQVTIQTKSVRWGEDGMGLSFVLPENMDLWLWKDQGLIEPEDILSEFRLARALAFLRRICPSVTQELKLLFREGLGTIRSRHAILIAHRAEVMLAAEPNFGELRAPESVVLRAVKEGSWADDQSTQALWAGILATACDPAGDDESNLPYMDLLAEMATVDSRLFIEACTLAPKTFSPNGAVSSRPLMRTAEQMMKLTGTHDLAKIDRNLLQLSILGLLEPRSKAKYFSFDQDANLTPTALGLELFARCQGHRGSPLEYYAARVPDAEKEIAGKTDAPSLGAGNTEEPEEPEEQEESSS